MTAWVCWISTKIIWPENMDEASFFTLSSSWHTALSSPCTPYKQLFTHLQICWIELFALFSDCITWNIPSMIIVFLFILMAAFLEKIHAYNSSLELLSVTPWWVPFVDKVCHRVVKCSISSGSWNSNICLFYYISGCEVWSAIWGKKL